MIMAKLTASLLRRACEAAKTHAALVAKITEAFEERYGTTHSAVDCDWLIEALDYGGGDVSTVAECDEAMALCGVKPRSKTKIVLPDERGSETR
jgi:hypothetical protein